MINDRIAGLSKSFEDSSRRLRTILPEPRRRAWGSDNAGPFCRKQSVIQRGVKTTDSTASDARSDGQKPMTNQL